MTIYPIPSQSQLHYFSVGSRSIELLTGDKRLDLRFSSFQRRRTELLHSRDSAEEPGNEQANR